MLKNNLLYKCLDYQKKLNRECLICFIDAGGKCGFLCKWRYLTQFSACVLNWRLCCIAPPSSWLSCTGFAPQMPVLNRAHFLFLKKYTIFSVKHWFERLSMQICHNGSQHSTFTKQVCEPEFWPQFKEHSLYPVVHTSNVLLKTRSPLCQ